MSNDVKNGYALSLLISGKNLELDYNEESEKNKDLISEERWNYAFWDQVNSKKIFNEKEIFIDWLDYIDYKKDKFYSIKELIYHPVFKKILINVLNDIRNEGIIKDKFGKEVLIIIHDLEYYDDINALTKKVNEKELLTNFFIWYKNF